MRKYSFTVTVRDEQPFRAKGIYYQGRNIIIVGDFDKEHTIRRKEPIQEVSVEICDLEQRKYLPSNLSIIKGNLLTDLNSFVNAIHEKGALNLEVYSLLKNSIGSYVNSKFKKS